MRRSANSPTASPPYPPTNTRVMSSTLTEATHRPAEIHVVAGSSQLFAEPWIPSVAEPDDLQGLAVDVSKITVLWRDTPCGRVYGRICTVSPNSAALEEPPACPAPVCRGFPVD